MKRTVKVELLGQSFAIKSEKSEAHLQKVAGYVNRKFDELRRQTRTTSSHDLALLVALNLADELFDQRSDVDEEKEMIRSRAQKALSTINHVLASAQIQKQEQESVVATHSVD